MFQWYNEEKITRDDEKIREEVSSLYDDMRAQFYKSADRALKDPDTYAVLNWLFLTGLHHFYLKEILKVVLA
jgi:hypothetical protein